MKTDKIWLLNDFLARGRTIFQIPVYQRNYDWTERNCSRLLDDVEDIFLTDRKHFLGAIIYMASEDAKTSFNIYTIIDGQQRITTMMLLLKALMDVINDGCNDCASEIEEALCNRHGKSEMRIKLKNSKITGGQFASLIENRFESLDKEGHLWLNYKLCQKRIADWVRKGLAPVLILNAIRKIEVVSVELRKADGDDPQVIFECINSTGVALSQSDLIRNFLLMDADDADELYEQFWLQIENALISSSGNYMDAFFAHWLAYKTHVRVNRARLYDQFSKIFSTTTCNLRSFLEELLNAAKNFRLLILDDDTIKHEMSERAIPFSVANALRGIRCLKQTTCYPFLMHVIDDYSSGVISADILEKTVKLVLSYLVRRIICDMPSDTLRSLFISAHRNIFKVQENMKRYFESVNKYFWNLPMKDAMPSDEKFISSLRRMDIYSKAYICRFMFSEIIGLHTGEHPDISKFAIERIMPQTLTSSWKHISLTAHEIWLNTIGNLTITGNTSEFAGEKFSRKKASFSGVGLIPELNSDVLDRDTWDIADIDARGQRLAKLIAKMYAIEQLTGDDIEFTFLTTHTVLDFGRATNLKLVSFRFDGEIYYQSLYTAMLIDIIKMLDIRRAGYLDELAKEGRPTSSLGTRKNKRPFLSTTPNILRVPYELRPGVYVETALSASRIMRFIGDLLDGFGLDKSDKEQFSVTVVVNEKSTETSLNASDVDAVARA